MHFVVAPALTRLRHGTRACTHSLQKLVQFPVHAFLANGSDQVGYCPLCQVSLQLSSGLLPEILGGVVTVYADLEAEFQTFPCIF